jgi:hypothetical protein
MAVNLENHVILRCERGEPRRMLTQNAAIGDGHPSRPGNAGHLRVTVRDKGRPA